MLMQSLFELANFDPHDLQNENELRKASSEA
jgi:hypothetical protein